MIMEIVNIEVNAFMEMNNILFKIEKQLKGLNSSKSELSEWLDNQDVCILMNISDRKLLSFCLFGFFFKTERFNSFQSYRQKSVL